MEFQKDFPRPPGWGLEHIPFAITNGTVTRGVNIPSGHIPLILHAWVKPSISDGTKLQNGTVIYYVAGPWGGIRSDPPSTQPPQKASLISTNSVTDTGYSTISPGGGTKNTSDPHAQLSVHITTPPPNRQQSQGPWGHGHAGFGWPSSTQLYDKTPETTTLPTRNQVTGYATTSKPKRTSSRVGTRSSLPSVDPVEAISQSRIPVSDSVRKFRRIVAQIRAITKKELANARRSREG